jgi:hypothetical protein
MNKLKLENMSYHNIIDYSLAIGFVAVIGGAVVPGFADSMTPIFSKLGSIVIDALFFFFFSA